MLGRRGSGRRPRAVSQKRKAEEDPEPDVVVKTELEDESAACNESAKAIVRSGGKSELETRWEWLNDGDVWTVYAAGLGNQISQAHGCGKKTVTVAPAVGVSLQLDFRKMVQKNTKSGYQRPIRLAIKEQDQYFVWQWQSDEGSWVSYDAKTCVVLETALHADEKLVSLSLGGWQYMVDLGAMVQKNSQTEHERLVHRCLSDAESDQPMHNAINAPIAVKRLRKSKSAEIKETEAEESNEKVRTLVLKGKAPVDPECSSKIGKAHVFCEADDVYDVMLNQEGITRHLEQHSLCEEYQSQQEHFQHPSQQYHSWHSMPGYNAQHNPHVPVSDLPPPESFENETIDLRQSPHYVHEVPVSNFRDTNNSEVHFSYPHRKSTVWDFFHLKDPSIGIRNATSAFCNLCTKEVKRGSTPGRLGTTAMRNHLAKHHQKEWSATGSISIVSAPPNTPYHYPMASTSQTYPQEPGLPLLRSMLDICYCFFATVCTLCGDVISRGETISANRDYLMLQHMQSAHCNILRVSLKEMQGVAGPDDESSSSSL